MENLGKNNSLYYFEAEYHSDKGNGMFIGVAPKLSNFNEKNVNFDGAFLLFCGDGEIKIKGDWKKYASAVANGSIVGVLVDMS